MGMSSDFSNGGGGAIKSGVGSIFVFAKISPNVDWLNEGGLLCKFMPNVIDQSRLLKLI